MIVNDVVLNRYNVPLNLFTITTLHLSQSLYYSEGNYRQVLANAR